MSDQERLAGYVEVWWTAVDELTRLLEELSPDDWHAGTDLEGWDVHAVAAHIAHLEAVLAGAPEETVDIGRPEHVTGLFGFYTEQGVVARRDRSPDELISEISESSTKRKTALLADPPTDPAGAPPKTPGDIGWTWERLLKNRPLDVWMHEQDIRRAVGRPGNLEGPPAQHTTDYLLESLPMIVGKRVAPPAGTTVVLRVEGSEPAAVVVGEDGRAATLAEPPSEPTVTLAMDRETFIVTAGGRRWPDLERITVTGDADVGRRVLEAMAVTP